MRMTLLIFTDTELEVIHDTLVYWGILGYLGICFLFALCLM